MGSPEPKGSSITQLFHLTLTDIAKGDGKRLRQPEDKEICCEIVSSRNDRKASPTVPR